MDARWEGVGGWVGLGGRGAAVMDVCARDAFLANRGSTSRRTACWTPGWVGRVN